jgi:hypothetical protein
MHFISYDLLVTTRKTVQKETGETEGFYWLQAASQHEQRK